MCRVNAFIKYGWDKNVCNPYGGDVLADPCGSGLHGVLPYPEGSWTVISKAFSSANVPQFNTSHIVAYFVTRTVSDCLPAADFKSVNKSAENLFRCGHVQSIQVCTTETHLYVRANCLPEMKKDRVYRVCMALTIDGHDLVHAECGCPAGRGPHGSCKHICAMCWWTSVDLSGYLISVPVQTMQLQQWNQPRGRSVDFIPVDKLGASRRELLPQKDRTYGSLMIFDPCPPSLREADPKALEEFRCDLLGFAQPCGFFNTSFHLLTKLNMTTRTVLIDKELNNPAVVTRLLTLTLNRKDLPLQPETFS